MPTHARSCDERVRGRSSSLRAPLPVQAGARQERASSSHAPIGRLRLTMPTIAMQTAKYRLKYR